MGADAGVQLGQLGRERAVIGQELPQADKRANDVNAHRDGFGGRKDVGGHQRPVLRESKRTVTAASAPVV